MFEEKRAHPRFKVRIPVEYRKLRESTALKKGSITEDISLGGTRFITEEFLAFTSRLMLDIDLPIPERSVNVLSKVSWIRKLAAEDYYEIGSQFLEMSKEDKNRLSHYLDRLAGSDSSP